MGSADAAHVWVTAVCGRSGGDSSVTNGRLTADHIHHIPAASHGCPKTERRRDRRRRRAPAECPRHHPSVCRKRARRIGLTAPWIAEFFSQSLTTRQRRAKYAPGEIHAARRRFLHRIRHHTLRRQPTYHHAGYGCWRRSVY
ncbi:hypothetical protein KCP70_21000 [Salmonella enterica subsp. enterica]|nr:hypothetical protein KCP70_21000 [Salmonella enterica subsp. enterica]